YRLATPTTWLHPRRAHQWRLRLLSASLLIPFSFSLSGRPRRSTLFPYTTLFRSKRFARSNQGSAACRLQRCKARGGLHLCRRQRSEEHTSELQSLTNLVCRLLLEKKKSRPAACPRMERIRRDDPARAQEQRAPPT